MSRWRPPVEQTSRYITAAGYARLDKELKQLWERRADVVRHLAAAAAEGDRSENAEYIYRKKELREIDRRIRYLQRRMPVLKVVATVPEDMTRVFFGAQVMLTDAAGMEHCYRIVGPDEADVASGYLSMDAPLARALLGRQVAEEVVVSTPDTSSHYTIIAIEYKNG